MAVEHRRLMDAWRELWGQYKAVIDAFDGLIYICSPKFEIEFVNRHLAEMLGCSPWGKSVTRLFIIWTIPAPVVPRKRCCGEQRYAKNPSIPKSTGLIIRLPLPFI